MKVSAFESSRPLARRFPANAWWWQWFQPLMPPAVRLIGAGLQFLSTVVVARTLGDSGGAGFFFWSAVLMTSGPIATYGLEQIALRNVPRLEKEGDEAVGQFVAVLRSIAVLVSFVLGLFWVGFAVFSEPAPGGFRLWHLLPPLALASIAVTLINGEALKGMARPVMGMVYGHLLPVSLFCVSVLLLAHRLDSPGILTLYTGAYLVGAMAIRFASARGIRWPLLKWPDRETRRPLLREGFSVCCVSLFGAFGFIVPMALLELTRPAAEVSHTATAFRLSILFLVLASAIHSVFAPALSRAAELPSPFRPVFRVYGKAVLLAVAVLILPLGIGIVFPGTVMSLFGESFRDGSNVLRFLLVVQLISLCLGPVPHLLLMTGYTAFLARLSLIKFVTAVTLAAILIPRSGSEGMILGIGVAYVAEEVVGLIYAIRKLRSSHRRVSGCES